MSLGAVTKVTGGKTSFILVKVVMSLENGNIYILSITLKISKKRIKKRRTRIDFKAFLFLINIVCCLENS